MTRQAGQAALDRGVVAIVAVAMQSAELTADDIYIVPELRPLRVPRDLHRLPRAEFLVRLAEQRGVVGAKLANLFGIIHPLGGLHRLKLVDLLLELGQGLLKLEHVAQRGPGSARRRDGRGTGDSVRTGAGRIVRVRRLCHIYLPAAAGDSRGRLTYLIRQSPRADLAPPLHQKQNRT